MPLAFTTILALSFLPDVFSGKMTIGQILYLLGLPLIVAFPIVLLASIVFGLPLTALLRRINREWFGVYVPVGFAIGSLIPIAILALIDATAGYWTAALGAISGAVTGYVWWAEARAHHDFNSEQTPPPLGDEM